MRSRRPLGEALGLTLGLTLGLALGACGGGVAPPSKPEVARPAPRPSPPAAACPEVPAPPPAAPLVEVRLPEATWKTLPGGTQVGVVPMRELPLVEARAVVRAGSAADDEQPGRAALAAETVRASLARRAASLGGRAGVRVLPDATIFSLVAPEARLGEALSALAAALRAPEPRAFSPERLRLEALAEAFLDPASPGALEAALFRELFAMPAERHPYAAFPAPAPADVEAASPADAERFRRAFYRGGPASLVLVGDVDPAAGVEAAARAFPPRREREPEAVSFEDPVAAGTRRIALVPSKALAEQGRSRVAVGLLGPRRGEEGYAAFEIAGEAARGLTLARLAEVRAGQACPPGPAPSAPEGVSAEVATHPRAEGPSVLVLHLELPVERTAEGIRAAAEALGLLGTGGAAVEEAVAAAARIRRGRLLAGLSGPAEVADALAEADALGLAGSPLAAHARALASASAEDVRRVAREPLRRGPALAVAGERARLEAVLKPFGGIKIVNPRADFAVRDAGARKGAPR